MIILPSANRAAKRRKNLARAISSSALTQIFIAEPKCSPARRERASMRGLPSASNSEQQTPRSKSDLDPADGEPGALRDSSSQIEDSQIAIPVYSHSIVAGGLLEMS